MTQKVFTAGRRLPYAVAPAVTTTLVYKVFNDGFIGLYPGGGSAEEPHRLLLSGNVMFELE